MIGRKYIGKKIKYEERFTRDLDKQGITYAVKFRDFVGDTYYIIEAFKPLSILSGRVLWTIIAAGKWMINKSEDIYL